MDVVRSWNEYLCRQANDKPTDPNQVVSTSPASKHSMLGKMKGICHESMYIYIYTHVYRYIHVYIYMYIYLVVYLLVVGDERPSHSNQIRIMLIRAGMRKDTGHDL